jgi:hypothetical protein
VNERVTQFDVSTDLARSSSNVVGIELGIYVVRPARLYSKGIIGLEWIERTLRVLYESGITR